MNDAPRHPSFAWVVAALASGQLLAWAWLYYGFSSFVLPMRDDLRWSEPVLMGAFSVGLAMWGAASYGVGAAIDRGHGRAVLGGGAVLGALGLAAWAAVRDTVDVVRGVGRARRGDGDDAVRPGVHRADQALSAALPPGHHRTHAGRRLCQHAVVPGGGVAAALLGWRGTLLAMAGTLLVVVAAAAPLGAARARAR